MASERCAPAAFDSTGLDGGPDRPTRARWAVDPAPMPCVRVRARTPQVRRRWALREAMANASRASFGLRVKTHHGTTVLRQNLNLTRAEREALRGGAAAEANRTMVALAGWGARVRAHVAAAVSRRAARTMRGPPCTQCRGRHSGATALRVLRRCRSPALRGRRPT